MRQLLLWMGALAAFLWLFGIFPGEDEQGTSIGTVAAVTDEDDRLDQAADEVADEVVDETFADVGDTGTCIEDCGGHDAGFEWAKEQGVTDASECGGTSQSFTEGCETYAEALEQRVSERTEDSDEVE